MAVPGVGVGPSISMVLRVLEPGLVMEVVASRALVRGLLACKHVYPWNKNRSKLSDTGSRQVSCGWLQFAQRADLESQQRHSDRPRRPRDPAHTAATFALHEK